MSTDQLPLFIKPLANLVETESQLKKQGICRPPTASFNRYVRPARRRGIHKYRYHGPPSRNVVALTPSLSAVSAPFPPFQGDDPAAKHSAHSVHHTPLKPLQQDLIEAVPR